MVYGFRFLMLNNNVNVQIWYTLYTLYINYIMCTVILKSTYIQYNFVVKCQMK